jgi:hypothetical protein
MGTRALIKVLDESNSVVTCLYSQWDGYPSGIGSALAAFLSQIKLINGITGKETRPVANGMGCLAAQLVVHFKKEVGSYYLVDPKVEHGEEYIYEVYSNKVRVTNYAKEVLYLGSWDLFSEFCNGSDD